jgi:hypothetical protein
VAFAKQAAQSHADPLVQIPQFRPIAVFEVPPLTHGKKTPGESE